MFATTEAHGSSSSVTLAWQPSAANSLGIPRPKIWNQSNRSDGLGQGKDKYFLIVNNYLYLGSCVHSMNPPLCEVQFGLLDMSGLRCRISWGCPPCSQPLGQAGAPEPVSVDSLHNCSPLATSSPLEGSVNQNSKWYISGKGRNNSKKTTSHS